MKTHVPKSPQNAGMEYPGIVGLHMIQLPGILIRSMLCSVFYQLFFATVLKLRLPQALQMIAISLSSFLISLKHKTASAVEIA